MREFLEILVIPFWDSNANSEREWKTKLTTTINFEW